jgi:Putative Flp pilus-assembly TadE/G-like
MKKIFGKPRGQVAVLYAGVIAVVIGAVALGADVAVMYVNWEHVQKTADAAAIAGAAFLSSDKTYNGTIASGCSGDNAEQAACTFAMNNDPALATSPNTVVVTEPSGNTLQVVATENSLPYFFAKAIGLSTYNISASAVAQAPGVVGTVMAGGTGLFPVGLQCAAPCPAGSLVGGEPVHFGTKFISTTINASGNWQWLDVSGDHGGGTPVLEAAISSGASATFSINPPNNQIYPETGNVGMNPNVAKALSDRLAKCSDITDGCAGVNPNDVPLNDPCMIIVPTVDFTSEHGKSSPLTIYGFALVYLDKANTTSTSINGCFISEITQDTLASSTATNLGALVTDVLTQ